MQDLDKLKQQQKDLAHLIKCIYTWAYRPTKDGAKLLRKEAEKLEKKYEKERI